MVDKAELEITIKDDGSAVEQRRGESPRSYPPAGQDQQSRDPNSPNSPRSNPQPQQPQRERLFDLGLLHQASAVSGLGLINKTVGRIAAVVSIVDEIRSRIERNAEAQKKFEDERLAAIRLERKEQELLEAETRERRRKQIQKKFDNAPAGSDVQLTDDEAEFLREDREWQKRHKQRQLAERREQDRKRRMQAAKRSIDGKRDLTPRAKRPSKSVGKRDGRGGHGRRVQGGGASDHVRSLDEIYDELGERIRKRTPDFKGGSAGQAESSQASSGLQRAYDHLDDLIRKGVPDWKSPGKSKSKNQSSSRKQTSHTPIPKATRERLTQQAAEILRRQQARQAVQPKAKSAGAAAASRSRRSPLPRMGARNTRRSSTFSGASRAAGSAVRGIASRASSRVAGAGRAAGAAASRVAGQVVASGAAARGLTALATAGTLAGGALAGVGIAAAAVGVGLGLLTVATAKMVSIFDAAARQYEDVSPKIATARAKQEATQTIGDIRRASTVDSELAKFVELQTEAGELWRDIKTILLDGALHMFLPLMEQGVELFRSAVTNGLEPMLKAVMKMQLEQAEANLRARELIPGNARMEAMERKALEFARAQLDALKILAEKEEGPEDPFFDQFFNMDTVPSDVKEAISKMPAMIPLAPLAMPNFGAFIPNTMH